jgi:nucleoid DNA-binding protein
MDNIPSSIDKRVLWKYVNRKIKRTIHHYHVFSIITLLFEEMLKDFKQGKEIKIFNLGTIVLKEMKPRRYHDVTKNEVVLSGKHKILRFTLMSKIRNKLCKHLNIDTTFKDD